MTNDNVKFLKQRQRDFSSRKRIKLNKSIIVKEKFLKEILIHNDWFKESKVIASFLSIKSEISTDYINKLINESNKIICLPTIKNHKETLIFKGYSLGGVLINGKFGVQEPFNTKIYLPDIIFTPCLAFDIFGFRLGYGGGYYDKTISYLNSIKHQFKTVGFAYDDQRVDSVIHDSLDKKLNYILTEKQLYKIL